MDICFAFSFYRTIYYILDDVVHFLRVFRCINRLVFSLYCNRFIVFCFLLVCVLSEQLTIINTNYYGETGDVGAAGKGRAHAPYRFMM